jgi:hypothetical protein
VLPEGLWPGGYRVSKDVSMRLHVIALLFALGSVLPGHVAAQSRIENDTDRLGGDYKGISKVYSAQYCHEMS